jgi:penicillin-binding protein 1A
MRKLIVALVGVLALLAPGAMTLWVSTPDVSDVQQRVKLVTDGYGVVLLAPDEIPPMLAKAVVAIEDERFWVHHGIDTIGLARAIFYDVTNGCLCQGGSTITEQLVKDVYLNGSDRGYNKVVDMVLALKLERMISKQQILADYLSEIPTGQNRYGVAAVACVYFHARLPDLTLGQYALLAGVTQAPSIYDPTVNPDAAAVRRTEVLEAMLSESYITPAQLASAEAEPILVPGPAPAAC